MKNDDESKLTGDEILSERAVILLSGGLDSYTCGALAREQGYECYGLTIFYGQRHECELQAAQRVARALALAEHKVLRLDLRMFGGSALTQDIAVPKSKSADEIATEGIPVTYVPARNTIFLSLALGWAEVLGAFDIFIGANAVDYSGYPDCRGEYIKAFEDMANLATKAAVEGKGRYSIHTPLLTMSKKEIIETGLGLGLDYGISHSCYDPDEKGRACGHCDACLLRLRGFAQLGIKDPAVYSEQ